MTINLSHAPSEIALTWVWPATAPVFPRGLPLGALTLVRVRNYSTEVGLRTLDDLFKSVVDAGMSGGLITGNCHVYGPGSGSTAVNVCTLLNSLPRSVRLTRVFESDDCLKPEALGETVAAEMARLACEYETALTVGFWWESDEQDAEATHALAALLKVARVVIDVIGSDSDGPLLTISVRPSAGGDLPYQRPVPRTKGHGHVVHDWRALDLSGYGRL